MAAKTKIKTFFEGRRRRVTLKSWQHLKTKAGEGRVKLNLVMPLLNENSQGMPGSVADTFILMQQDESAIGRTKLIIMLEGMTLEFFTTDNIKSPVVSSTGGMMDKFAISASGAAEKRVVDLEFVAYIPANIFLRDWAWEHLHSDFFLESTYSQSEFELSIDPVVGEARNDDSPAEEEDEEAPSDGQVLVPDFW